MLGLLFEGPAIVIHFLVSEFLYIKPHDCLSYKEEVENYSNYKISNQSDRKTIHILKNRIKIVMIIRDVYAEESYLCEYAESILKLLYYYIQNRISIRQSFIIQSLH